MSRKNLATVLTILLITSVLQGCTQASNSDAITNDNTNRSVKVSTVAGTNAALDSSNASEAKNTAGQSANTSPSLNKQSPPSAAGPVPKIGSGASDMVLFTQVRGKLSSDKELINGVVVEIKEGNVTLKGQVSNEEQKKKAEQLVQEVQGIKSIKNNLRISS